MKRPVTIYAEMTPNPNTMKFVADSMLVDPGQVVEFLNRQEAVGHSSLAEALFNFELFFKHINFGKGCSNNHQI